jgi:hypothetical protein
MSDIYDNYYLNERNAPHKIKPLPRNKNSDNLNLTLPQKKIYKKYNRNPRFGSEQFSSVQTRTHRPPIPNWRSSLTVNLNAPTGIGTQYHIGPQAGAHRPNGNK